MRNFFIIRAPRRIREMTLSQRREAVATLRDFAIRQRDTRITLADQVSPEALAQIEWNRWVFDAAADLFETAAKKTPLDDRPELDEMYAELVLLRRCKFDVLGAEQRAGMAENQLKGATAEIDELKKRILELSPNGDPLVKLLDNQPEKARGRN